MVARQGVGQVVARQVGVRDVGQVRVDGKGGGQAGSGARWWPGEMMARRDGGEMVARWLRDGGEMVARWWPGEIIFCQG